MTYAPREAACIAREKLHNILHHILGYKPDTLAQAINDAFKAGHLLSSEARSMHSARRNMTAIIKAKAGGNGSKTPDSNRVWRFYLEDRKMKKHAPRQAAAQTRAILHARLDRKLGYTTSNLYQAIQEAYYSYAITEEDYNDLYVARKNMNAIVHAKSNIIRSNVFWQDYIHGKPKRTTSKPEKLKKRKKTK